MIGNISSTSASTYIPAVSFGRPTVGQESGDLKASSFKPLEQSAGIAGGENRRAPDDRPAEQGERQRLSADAAPVQAAEQKEQRESAKKEQILKEQKQIETLAARDREVRAHETAHAAVGGPYAGSPTYEFVRGPNGVNYAVGGEVSIDTSPVANDPEATILKARQVKAAANAPAETSAQDRKVAAAAASMEIQAEAELRAQESAKLQEIEQQAELSANEQKTEESKKIAEDERRLSEEKEQEQARRDSELEQSRQARAEILARANQQTIDLTRKLTDIGAIQGYSSVGTFLNSTV